MSTKSLSILFPMLGHSQLGVILLWESIYANVSCTIQFAVLIAGILMYGWSLHIAEGAGGHQFDFCLLIPCLSIFSLKSGPPLVNMSDSSLFHCCGLFTSRYYTSVLHQCLDHSPRWPSWVHLTVSGFPQKDSIGRELCMSMAVTCEGEVMSHKWAKNAK